MEEQAERKSSDIGRAAELGDRLNRSSWNAYKSKLCPPDFASSFSSNNNLATTSQLQPQSTHFTRMSIPKVQVPGVGSAGRVGLGLMSLTVGASPPSEEVAFAAIK